MEETKILLIVEDDLKQLKELDKGENQWFLGLTAYEGAYTREYLKQSLSSAYTKKGFGDITTDKETREEIRNNIFSQKQELIQSCIDKGGIPLYTTFARTYEEFEAEKELGIDGVILDMHFPLRNQPPFNTPQPIGVRAAFELEEADIPFVINTAWYHHGKDTQWIFELVNSRQWPILETMEDGLKDWKTAIKTIKNMMVEKYK